MKELAPLVVALGWIVGSTAVSTGGKSGVSILWL
jgi:hypothetical protein